MSNQFDRDIEAVTCALDDTPYQPNKVDYLERKMEADIAVNDYSKDVDAIINDIQRNDAQESLRQYKDTVKKMMEVRKEECDKDFDNITSNLNDITYQPNKMNSLRREEEAEKDVKDYSKEIKTTLKDIQRNYEFERNKQQESLRKYRETVKMMKEEKRKPNGIPKKDYDAEEELRGKLKEQEDRFREELNEMRRKIQEERERKREEYKKEYKEEMEKSRQCIKIFNGCLILKNRWEEEQPECEDYLSSIRRALTRVLIEYQNYKDDVHQFQRGKQHEMEGFEKDQLEYQFICLYKVLVEVHSSICNEFEFMGSLIAENDRPVLKVIQKILGLIGTQIADIVDSLVNSGNYTISRESKDAFTKLSPNSVPTARELIELVKNPCEYQDIQRPKEL